MSNWIHINDQKPEENRDLFYFFEVLGVYRGKYERSQLPEELFEDGTEPIYCDTFYGKSGFLSDDVTHWMYVDGQDEGYLPDVPEGYILLDDKFSGYALESETIRIRKDVYESLREQLKYLDAGHLNGLVCQGENCSCHIYWKEDVDGYKCGCCGEVYDTQLVEEDTYKFESIYERPCPNCNPHKDDNSMEFYQCGFLEYNDAGLGYYQCTDCDSTYNVGENGKVIV